MWKKISETFCFLYIFIAELELNFYYVKNKGASTGIPELAHTR